MATLIILKLNRTTQTAKCKIIYLLIFILIHAGKFLTTNNLSLYEYNNAKNTRNYNLFVCVSFSFYIHSNADALFVITRL